MYNDGCAPKINSILLVTHNGRNYIGIVDGIVGNDMYVLLLSQNGRIKIDINSDWTQLNLSDLSALRYNYKLFIGDDIESSIDSAYKLFAGKYLKK